MSASRSAALKTAACSAFDPGPGERLPQGLACALVGKGGKFRSEPPGNRRQGQGIAAAHDSLDPKFAPMSLHHICCRTAD
jgi:hypothetical protein